MLSLQTHLSSSTNFITLKSGEYCKILMSYRIWLSETARDGCTLSTGTRERVNKVREATGGSGAGRKTAASLMHRHSFH